MFYCESEPSADLGRYIFSFWEFSVPEDGDLQTSHEIFPDGCVSVFYYQNPRRAIYQAGISSLQLASIVKTVSAGDTFYGMRLSPAACAGLLGCDPATLDQDLTRDSERFSHLTGELVARLKDVQGLEAAIKIFEGVIRDLIGVVAAPDKLVVDAVRIIEAQRGEIRVDALAAKLHFSQRQLQRRFKASSGLSPKQYARIRRLRATAVIVAENKNVNWAERAAEMGFSDQAHLTHEFTAVTNRSPISFADKIGKIRHGNLVK